MKKVLLTGLSLFLLNLGAHGAFLSVETMTPFSTDAPPEIVKLKSLGEIQLAPEVLIQEGDILTGELTHVKHAKRLKRNATFKYKINSVKPVDGESFDLSEYNEGKYVSEIKINKGKLATNAALKAGELFVSGISVSYRAVEGAIKNRKEGISGVATGAVENVYDNSVLSYIKKGTEIEKKQGDKFYLSLKPQKNNEKHNQIEPQTDRGTETDLMETDK